MCRIDYIEEMALAGVTSFKIEGRLKDFNYVKNVTAAYSERLDKIVKKYPEKFRRESKGNIDVFFKPDVEKSFNRGFTDYFLHGENNAIISPNSPKAIGKRVGKIREIYTDSIILETQQNETAFANGDGLCTFMPDGTLIGFRVNRVDGKRLYTGKTVHGLRRGMIVYRNFDKAFDDILSGQSADRRLPIDIDLDFNPDKQNFTFTVNNEFSKDYHFETQLAKSPQRDNIQRQLAKMGNTPFVLRSLNINYPQDLFIPSSVLAYWRREITQAYADFLQQKNNPNITTSLSAANKQSDIADFGISAGNALQALEPINIANRLSMSLYKAWNTNRKLPLAFEISADNQGKDIMTCRHCIRFALGWCPFKQQPKPGAPSSSDSLFLVLKGGRRLSLHFDCNKCVMTIKDEIN